MSERSHEQTVVSMAVMAMQANNRFDDETAERLLQVFDAGYESLEARLSKMEEALRTLADPMAYEGIPIFHGTKQPWMIAKEALAGEANDY